jgi:glycosyltransferase involved in cell wall biosynthesis
MGRRILIDALAARYGGNAYAAVQLARELARRGDVSAVTVLARSGSIVARGLVGASGVKCIALAPASRMELAGRLAWEGARLPALVREERSSQVISMSGMLPRAVPCELVCLLANPVLYEAPGPGNLLRRWAIARTARRGARLVAPSHSMAELVSASVGRSCAVAPFGVDHATFRPGEGRGEEILCVADFYAHKRHDLLLDAWIGLPAPRPVMRFVGNPAVDPRAHAALLAHIARLPEADSIALEYRVPLERLVRAYRRARVFAMPSERESFCMPLAESMACGVPAVARGLASLRETGGAGASYLDGDDPAAWTDALRRLIERSDEHERARRSAIDAAARFSWGAFAAELVGGGH